MNLVSARTTLEHQTPGSSFSYAEGPEMQVKRPGHMRGRVLLEAPNRYRPGLPSFIGPKWLYPKIQRRLKVLLRSSLQARRRK